METTGQRLKQLRKEHKYTLDQVGNFLNTTKVTISRYENDVRVPTSEPLSKLSKLYNVSSDYLLCISDKKNQLTEDIPFTKEDEIEVSNRINEYMKELTSQESLALHGEPMCEEALESLLNAMEIGLKMALKKQKQKQKMNQIKDK